MANVHLSVVTVSLVIALVVSPGLLVTCALCLGIDRLRLSVTDLQQRLADIAPYVGLVVLLTLFKYSTAGARQRLSHALEWNITDSLYAVEGPFVANLQMAVPEATYGFFSGMYMFGFPYLLAVPPIVYFVASSHRHLKELLVAYVLNHAVGLICYTLFIAYGPRNWIPSHVDGVMYQLYPWTQVMTAAVSSNTNVFPSLHTSLSVVVLLFAWRTRKTYPGWFVVAAFTATSVLLSTMVLGIHWASDLVAGLALGVWSVVAGVGIVARLEGNVDTTAAGDDSIARSNVGD